MKKYKPGTNSHKIFQLMDRALAAGGDEIEVPKMYNRHNEPLERNTFAMFMRRIRIDNFPGVDFYTRTRRDRVLVMGVRNPENQLQ